MRTQNGRRLSNVSRRFAYLVVLVTGLLLAACTQIPVEIQQLLAVTTVEPVATEIAAADDSEPAGSEAVVVATPTEAPTEAPTKAPSEAATVTPTQVPTATETATSAPELLLPSPTQETDAPAFVFPTPTPRVTLDLTETVSATTTITSALALAPSSSVTATEVVSDGVPGFVFPTATPRPAFTATAQITSTLAAPMARVLNSINVRSGPGTNYPVIAGLSPETRVEILGRNAASDWLQVAYAAGSIGWLSAPLVEVEGDATSIALITEIPTPPPTATPAPATATPSAPVNTASATPAPAAPATGLAEFRVINKRLWDVYENGGSLDGPSVTCGEKRQLVVTVLDAAGNRLNGVAVQAQYGAREIFYTGEGKGDGNVEFVLGGGQDVKVLRDNDGSEAISEMATGLSTHPAGIDVDQLIQARYCSDAQSCQAFIDAPGCYGHFSWTVSFQRNR